MSGKAATGCRQTNKERAGPDMHVWSWVLLAVGTFVAVTSLVPLMRRRRDQLVDELGAAAREEQNRKRLAEMIEKRKQKRKVA